MNGGILMDAVDPVVLLEMYQRIIELTAKIEASNKGIYRWIPALVGLLSFVGAILVSLIARHTVQDQINASRDTALKQIEAAKDQLNKQLRANVIAASRREWIELLREKIAKFISIGSQFHDHVALGRQLSDEAVREFWDLRIYIQLMLNENEEEHKKFLADMDEFILACVTQLTAEEKKSQAKKDAAVERWKGIMENFKGSSRKVIKSAWDKVKTLE